MLAYLQREPRRATSSRFPRTTATTTACAPTCKQLEEEEGSPAGPLLHLVNYVAAAVAKEYPNVAIDTLAYQYTRKPPLHVKPLPNVIVRLCSIECDFSQPLTAREQPAVRRRHSRLVEDLPAAVHLGLHHQFRATTSSRTRTCGCWGRTSGSSWRTASRASSSRVRTPRSGPSSRNSRPGCWPSRCGTRSWTTTSWWREFVQGYYGRRRRSISEYIQLDP